MLAIPSYGFSLKLVSTSEALLFVIPMENCKSSSTLSEFIREK